MGRWITPNIWVYFLFAKLVFTVRSSDVMCSLKSPSPKQESSKCPIDKKNPRKKYQLAKVHQKNPYTISIKLDTFKQNTLFGPEKNTSPRALPLRSRWCPRCWCRWHPASSQCMTRRRPGNPSRPASFGAATTWTTEGGTTLESSVDIPPTKPRCGGNT